MSKNFIKKMSKAKIFFLGDLWSYNSELNRFVVSPEPDVKVIPVDVKSHRCLIFGTDGLWNMLSAQSAVAIVQATDRHNENHLIASQQAGNGVSFILCYLYIIFKWHVCKYCYNDICKSF